MCAACVRLYGRLLRRSERHVRVPMMRTREYALDVCICKVRWGTDRTFHEGGDRLASPVCKNLYIT